MHYVRCYGGCYHGRLISLDGSGHVLRVVKRYGEQGGKGFRQVRGLLDFGRSPPPERVTKWVDDVDMYNLERCGEQGGKGFRQVKVFILEGHSLSREEVCQIEEDLRSEMWQPIEPPNFLTEFDEWFAWCAYKHTRNINHIWELLYESGSYSVGVGG